MEDPTRRELFFNYSFKERTHIFIFLNFTDILFQEMQAKQISNKFVIYSCIKQIGCKILKTSAESLYYFLRCFLNTI